MITEAKPKKCFSCPSIEYTTMVFDDINSGALMVLPLCKSCQEELTARDSEIIKVMFRVNRAEFVRFLALCDGMEVSSERDPE